MLGSCTAVCLLPLPLSTDTAIMPNGTCPALLARDSPLLRIHGGRTKLHCSMGLDLGGHVTALLTCDVTQCVVGRCPINRTDTAASVGAGLRRTYSLRLALIFLERALTHLTRQVLQNPTCIFSPSNPVHFRNSRTFRLHRTPLHSSRRQVRIYTVM